MKLDYPGLLVEKLPSGNKRYRVRVEGKPNKRIRLHLDPEHSDFREHYNAARMGIEVKPEMAPEDKAKRLSLSWLIYKYLAAFEKLVDGGQYSTKTLKKRTRILKRLQDEYGEYSMYVPQPKIIEIRNDMIETPAAADSMVEALRVMYRWGIDLGICDTNPAMGVGKVDRGKGGAVAWSIEDLKQYRKKHKPGSTPHLLLTLLMFTACRIGDAVWLGRKQEFERGGIRGLGWQPEKKNASFVEIPMLPPLYNATRAAKVQGKTYILNAYGRPFSSGDSLGSRFRDWCKDAGLKNRSAHGIRKAAGRLLAQEGCSQYQIMAIHGHTEAATSEIYTKGADRWRLATEAMKVLEGMDW